MGCNIYEGQAVFSHAEQACSMEEKVNVALLQVELIPATAGTQGFVPPLLAL